MKCLITFLLMAFALPGVIRSGSRLISTPTPTPAPTPTPPGINLPSNYQLAWNQDFTSSVYANINTSGIITSTTTITPPAVWKDTTVGASALYSLHGVDGKPFSTSKGYLSISTFDAGNGTDHGGILSSASRHGTGGFLPSAPVYWECKMRLPAGGANQWPIWWFFTANPVGTGQKAGEIDIAEGGYQIPGSTKSSAPLNLHEWTNNGSPWTDNWFACYELGPLSVTRDGFHVWSMWLVPGDLKIYIDGTLKYENKNMPAVFSTTKMQCIFQMTNFSPATTSTLGELDVKYVRCWTGS